MAEMTVHEKIRALLDDARVPYRAVHHEPTRTSEESARVRGEDIRVGGKALVLKVGQDFKLFVLSAALKADSKKIKAHFGERDVRFATAEELLSLTGLVPGAVPPFGRPVTPLELYVDPSILGNDRIAFNAGSLTDSIIMSREDYICVARPQVPAFAG